MANIYTPELKKQHVDDWRCSGLTRREYAALHAINFNTFKHWPAQLATLSLTNMVCLYIAKNRCSNNMVLR